MRLIVAGLVVLLLVGCATERQRAYEAYRNHDYKTALADYKELSDSGDSFADEQLSFMYYSGLGVDADPVEGERLTEKAAMDGDEDAVTVLTNRYLPPKTDPPDYAQALKWLKVGADHRDHYCQLEVSIYYENGMGVPRDQDEALHWLNAFVGDTNVAGAPIQYKYKGGDNIGGFMLAMQWALIYSPYYKDASRYADSGQVWLGFDYHDGRATNVQVTQSSGNPEADAAAVSLLQRTPLPPVLASLQSIQHFVIGFNFGQAAPGVVQTK